MTDKPSAASTYIGQRANPHPLQGARYVVEVIDQADGEVAVRYVSLSAPPWWITESAWISWRELGPVPRV